MKMIFEYFQMEKWMLQTVRAEKVPSQVWWRCGSGDIFLICHLTWRDHVLWVEPLQNKSLHQGLDKISAIFSLSIP